MDQTEETWGIDEHGELRGGFKPSGYPGVSYGHTQMGHTLDLF